MGAAAAVNRWKNREAKGMPGSGTCPRCLWGWDCKPSPAEHPVAETLVQDGTSHGSR